MRRAFTCLIYKVEVKGPGDTLSSTQKVWIDVMLSAGIQVEVSASLVFCGCFSTLHFPQDRLAKLTC